MDCRAMKEKAGTGRLRAWMRRLVCAALLAVPGRGLGGPEAVAESAAEWVAAMRAAGTELAAAPEPERPRRAFDAWRALERRFPLASDWLLQDGLDAPLSALVPAGGRDGWVPGPVVFGPALADLLQHRDPARWARAIRRVLDELGEEAAAGLARDLAEFAPDAEESARAELYLRACAARRALRLRPLLDRGWPGIVFARHHNMGGSHYAYTEALSDARHERNFHPGAALCLLRLDGLHATVETLLEAPEGVIRDVDVSWDGATILFAWKKSDRGDDYGLYTMDAGTREITRITGAKGHADYEGVFLPDGDILFNSTRCVQIVDCWFTEVSNLYTCAPDGRFLRRVTFDQVHDNYPTVLEDGRVVYTRWDYNDRGQLFPQALFQMNPDGTAQQEYYGNGSWFPTTILHARGIPGTAQVLAVVTGHHSFQAGQLAVIDPARGRQENEGVQLVAPVRATPAERIDSYGQEGGLFMYPWPIDERHMLVSHAPLGWAARDLGHQLRAPAFGLYFMDLDGRREWLDRDDATGRSAGRMVPLAARPRPHRRPAAVDYRKDTGTYYVQDVYEGEGLAGVPRGTIKRLRVIALEYRAAGIGHNMNAGPAGGALVSQPISIMGAWDVKRPLGEARVHEDGSALFEAPARTPVYFQALDAKGHAVQGMRSWSTLQPGETFSCVGCHTTGKRNTPPPRTPSLAMRAGVQPLDPVYGPPEGFSFPRRIQPILDRHCIACHHPEPGAPGPFSLTGRLNPDPESGRAWSDAYLSLVGPPKGGVPFPQRPDTGPVRWINPQSTPPMPPPYHTGAARSPLMTMLETGHQGLRLTADELRMIALWIDLAVPFAGEYAEANLWPEETHRAYDGFLEKRRTMEAEERKGTSRR
jgi:hypothetical protein